MDVVSASRIETGSVMRLGVIRQTSLRADTSAGASSSAAAAEAPTESRALVAIAAAVPREPPLPYRHAPFLAHLIATKEQLPQTRERRRASPQEAIAAYRAVAKLIGDKR
jgi:hypothetical protein